MAIPKTGLSHLAREPMEMKKEAHPIAYKPSKYSYGTQINLNKEELEKLGIEEMPKVGEEFRIIAVAKTTSVSESKSERAGEGEGKEEARLELQITHMKIFHESEVKAAEKEEKGETEAEEKAESPAKQKREQQMGVERSIGNWK